MSKETQDERVPVTLLTGFLGAGKTTLLNHLIRDPEAGRIAVIMNEFGDVGLDHDLIEDATEETILMQSGCLCCTFRGDISTTLGSLVARKKIGELAFDRVVIETTGIADPGPIMHTLVVDDLIARAYRLDGVVTLADAANGQRTLDTQIEAVRQIAMADLIIVTKSDLVAPLELEQFEVRLAEINGSARRVRAEHGDVPASTLFSLSAMRPSVNPKEVSDWLGTPKTERAASAEPAEPAQSESNPKSISPLSRKEPHAHHTDRIRSASIEVADPIPASVFDFWLDTLIALKGADILRTKGIVHVEDALWPFVFHGVQHIFDAPVPLKSWSGKDTTSRVVVIARDIDKEDLKASLETLRMRPKNKEARVEGMMADCSETPF